MEQGSKVCPDCAETILEGAWVCRFCGYRFDASGAPSGSAFAPPPGQAPPPNPGYGPPPQGYGPPTSPGYGPPPSGYAPPPQPGYQPPTAYLPPAAPYPPSYGPSGGTPPPGKRLSMGAIIAISAAGALLLAVVLWTVIHAPSKSIERRSNSYGCEYDTKTLKTAIVAWNTEYLSGDNPSAYATPYPPSERSLIDPATRLLQEESELHDLVGGGATVPTITKASGECNGETIVQLS